jgi:hypothetical protein
MMSFGDYSHVKTHDCLGNDILDESLFAPKGLHLKAQSCRFGQAWGRSIERIPTATRLRFTFSALVGSLVQRETHPLPRGGTDCVTLSTAFKADRSVGDIPAKKETP